MKTISQFECEQINGGIAPIFYLVASTTIVATSYFALGQDWEVISEVAWEFCQNATHAFG